VKKDRLKPKRASGRKARLVLARARGFESGEGLGFSSLFREELRFCLEPVVHIRAILPAAFQVNLIGPQPNLFFQGDRLSIYLLSDLLFLGKRCGFGFLRSDWCS
jgi:hypothetical protein